MSISVSYFGRTPQSRTKSLRSSCPGVGKRVSLELEGMFLVTIAPSTMNYDRILVFENFKNYYLWIVSNFNPPR